MRLTADRYRFHLVRRISENVGTLAWVMLNPSTADETTDDATVRKVIHFTDAAGYGTAHVVNLSPVRATDPKDLAALVEASNAYYGENCEAIESACRHAQAVVLAWGATKLPKGLRTPVIVGGVLLPPLLPVFSLGITAAGHPKHPVRLSPSTELEPYPPPRSE